VIESSAAGTLTERLKARAFGLGFDVVGVTALGAPPTYDAFDAWLARGHHGEMRYLEGNGAALRADARLPHIGATHAVVCAKDYGGRTPRGPIARYARGDDYHDVMRQRLRELAAWLEDETGAPIDARPYVDSGPVLERDLAQRAGLGWFGKNTMLIDPRGGSYRLLCALFVRATLREDAPFDADRCGSCTRCLDACPTDAFVAPRVLDATRCISYLTIEHRGEIPVELRSAIGEWIFGCDVCQEVCPWNVRFARDVHDAAFAPRAALDGVSSVALARLLLTMSPSDYAQTFRRSAVKRAKLWMLQRNAAVVLGNVGGEGDAEFLLPLHVSHDVVREHVAWAIEQIRRRCGRSEPGDG
jgi:epoxyqueuosine reductase